MKTHCRCGDRGLLKIGYQDGTPFDVAICRCATGRRFRLMPIAVLAGILGLPEDRVRPLEELSEPDDPWTVPIAAAPDFLQAGQVGKRAKL